MNAETNKASMIPTMSEGKMSLYKDMVQELQHFTQRVPMLFETFLTEYIEMNHITEKELSEVMRVYYPEESCSVMLTAANDVADVILGTRITSEINRVDGGFKITYHLDIVGSVLDELDEYPRTKQFLADIQDGGNTQSPT